MDLPKEASRYLGRPVELNEAMVGFLRRTTGGGEEVVRWQERFCFVRAGRRPRRSPLSENDLVTFEQLKLQVLIHVAQPARDPLRFIPNADAFDLLSYLDEVRL